MTQIYFIKNIIKRECMITTIIPELVVNDIEANIAFFIENFNFAIKQKETVKGRIKFVELISGDNSIYLQSVEFTKLEFPKFKTKLNSSNLILFQYEDRKEFENLYKSLENKEISLYSEMHDTEYGTREFVVLSPDNYLIEVWCKL